MAPSLTPQQWRVVEHLFHAACDAPPHARAALVQRGAFGEPEIERVVLRLLAADAEPTLLDAGIQAMVSDLLSG